MAFALRHGTLTLADMQALRSRIEQDIHNHKGWYIFQGIVFLFFGFLAGILPGVTALSATLFIGTMLFITGIFQLITSFKSRMHWWSLLSAVLSIGVGGWMWLMPVTGTFALILGIAIFFAVEGTLEILLALEFRPARNWGWMLAAGIATWILAILLWSGFPALSVLYLGILIAINFIFYGISLLMLVGNASRE